MPYIPVDINKIKLDGANPVVLQGASDQPDYLTQSTEPKGGYVPVDITKITLDAPEQSQGVGRTLFDQGMQGATFGFSDEISDAMGAFGTKVYSQYMDPELTSGKTIGDLYNEARGKSRERLNAQMEQNPVTSIAANIAGGLFTGGAGATTKAGSAVANSLRAGNTATRIGKGALAGAASGGLYGAGSAEDGDRLKGAATGAAVGAALPVTFGAGSAAVKSAGKALTPVIEEGTRPVVALAQKYKIPVALHQVAQGNALKNFQKVSSQLPFSGDAKFRDSQMKAFNSALIDTVGGSSNKFTPELMDNLFTKIGKEFDDFGKGKTFNLNDEFIKGTARLVDDASQIASKDGLENINKAISHVYSNADEAGNIAGEKLGLLRNKVNSLARKAAKSNPETAELLHDLENVIVDTMKAGDDAAGKAFAKTKQKYKNLLVLEPLTNKAKAGNISPTELKTRVAKIYGRQFTRGQAGEIGDLARIGSELLPELGGSDTVQKAIYAGGAGSLGTAALINPMLALGAAAKGGVVLGANRAAQAAINRNPAVLNAAMKKSRLASAAQKAIK